MSAEIITVWGSPSGGKTVISLALAAKIAGLKKNVIVINGDKLVPGLSVYFPTSKFTSQDSIGPLLMSNRYSDIELAERIKPHPKSEFLAFMGLSSAENYISYHEFTKASVIRMINKLGNQTDYLIIDGTSNPLENMLTLTGLEISDTIIRVMTPDPKGIAYMNAAKNIYRDERFRYNDHITVLGNVKNISPDTEITAVMGNFDFVLKYSHEAESKFIAGEMMTGFGRRDGLLFEKTVDMLYKKICEKPEPVSDETPADE